MHRRVDHSAILTGCTLLVPMRRFTLLRHKPAGGVARRDPALGIIGYGRIQPTSFEYVDIDWISFMWPLLSSPRIVAMLFPPTATAICPFVGRQVRQRGVSARELRLDIDSGRQSADGFK